VHSARRSPPRTSARKKRRRIKRENEDKIKGKIKKVARHVSQLVK
jgi:hypothetical protein